MQGSGVRGQGSVQGGYFPTDITLLNQVYQAAKAVLIQPDKFALERLARAVILAEGNPQGD